MAEVLLPGVFYRQSEFVNGLTGACGPNALAMAWSWSVQQYHSTYDVYQSMYSLGLCDANGVTNMANLLQAAQALGISAPDYRPYAEPWPDWADWLLRHLSAGDSVLIQTSVGQALTDAISGQGESAFHLQYHFLVIVGRNDGGYSSRAGIQLPAGWWATDGANAAPGNVLQFYPDTVMTQAAPCAALAVSLVRGSLQMALVRNADGSATDPTTGQRVGKGLADFIWSRGYENESLVLGERQYSANDVCAATAAHVLYWNIPKAWPTDTLGGEVLKSIFAEMDAANAQVASLRHQLAVAQAQLAQGGGAATGSSSTTDPQATQAVAVLRTLKTVLGSL